MTKHPEINNNNIEDWTSQNFSDLGNTLKELISLIRFKDITGQDFRYKIMPYQKLLPKGLLETLLDYYIVGDDRSYSNLLPQRKLINQKLILLFASWIDRKTPPYDSSEEVKYKFKLLFRSSQDGLNPTTFHQKCDNVNRTLVVGKIQNSEQIIGGYNPVDWNGNRWINTTESFIFNINNRNDPNAARFSYAVRHQDNAVYCNPSNLPVFGVGHDLFFGNNGTIFSSSNNAYNNINIVSGSKFDELEVFQIINRN